MQIIDTYGGINNIIDISASSERNDTITGDTSPPDGFVPWKWDQTIMRKIALAHSSYLLEALDLNINQVEVTMQKSPTAFSNDELVQTGAGKKRGRENKTDEITELGSKIEVMLLQLGSFPDAPPIIQTVIANMKAFKTASDTNKAIGLKTAMMSLDIEGLRLLADSSSSNNVPHKIQCISKQIFKEDYLKMNGYTRILKVCETLLETAVELGFTRSYMDESGTFHGKQYASDIQDVIIGSVSTIATAGAKDQEKKGRSCITS